MSVHLPPLTALRVLGLLLLLAVLAFCWRMPRQDHACSVTFGRRSASAPRTIVDGLKKQYRRREKIKVTIIARDATGAQVPRGGDSFYVEMRGPSIHVATVLDNRNGTYFASIVCEDPGMYTLIVRLDFTGCSGLDLCDENKTVLLAEHIQGSPFEVFVLPQLALDPALLPFGRWVNRSLAQSSKLRHRLLLDNWVWLPYVSPEQYTLVPKHCLQHRAIMLVGDSLDLSFFLALSELITAVYGPATRETEWDMENRITDKTGRESLRARSYKIVWAALNVTLLFRWHCGECNSFTPNITKQLQDNWVLFSGVPQSIVLNYGLHHAARDLRSYHLMVTQLVDDVQKAFRGSLFWRTTLVTQFHEPPLRPAWSCRTRWRVLELNKIANEVMQRRGIPVLDVAPFSEGRYDACYDNRHYTRKLAATIGNEIIHSLC